VTDTEKIWLKKSQEGDVDSFEKLIAKHQQKVYNIAYRMMGNEEDAKDAAQEALIKIYKNIGRFRGDSGFTTWVYRIAVNACKDELRKKKHNVISLDKETETEEGSFKHEFADQNLKPDELLEQAELNEIIQSSIQVLPEQNRVAIILRDIQGFSYEDISKVLDCPVGTVKSRINRGRKLLKDILSQNPRWSYEAIV